MAAKMTYQIKERVDEFGACVQVTLFEDDFEAGGGVFPADPEFYGVETPEEALAVAREDAEQFAQSWAGGGPIVLKPSPLD